MEDGSGIRDSDGCADAQDAINATAMAKITLNRGLTRIMNAAPENLRVVQWRKL
jgi:hypothetical protein